MNQEKIPFWRDERVLKIGIQALAVILVLTVVIILGKNLIYNFRQLGLNFGFNFLDRPASFDIGDKAINYQPSNSYSRALLVGFLNSLRVMVIGIFLATIIGVIIGISRLSDNWLVRHIALVYVETLRNTPLLLQLFFWYFAVFLKFPKVNNSIVLAGAVFLNNKGMYIPWPSYNLKTALGLAILLLSFILGLIVWRRQTKLIIQQGQSPQYLTGILGGVAIAFILSFIWGLDWQQPQFNSDTSSLTGGLNLSPEFATLLIGLTVYTAAFIAEVVRAGIKSVNKGQWEAAKALGLKPGLVMRLVIFPQALRLMIPPLTSEFLNLAKNSSLAIAIGYFDIYLISNTIANQTGRSLEMLIIVMTIYLIINLIISGLMNWLNRRSILF